MGIWPRWVAQDPQERTLDRVANLERGLASSKRNQQAAGVQTGKSTNQPGVAGATSTFAAPSVLASVTVNLPASDSLVMLNYFVGTAKVSVGTTSITIGFAFDASAPSTLWSNSNTGALSVANQPTMPAFYSQYPVPIILNAVPGMGLTAGDHTFTLVAYRSAGAGTITAQTASLWINVL